MPKKALCMLLSILLFPGIMPVFSETEEIKTPLYDPADFPQWSKDLRRAEIIAFGSLPFTVFFSKVAVDSYRWSQNDWDRRYAPWPLKSAGAIEMSEKQRIGVMTAGAVTAVVLAGVDHLIMRSRRKEQKRREEDKAVIVIEEYPLDGVESDNSE